MPVSLRFFPIQPLNRVTRDVQARCGFLALSGSVYIAPSTGQSDPPLDLRSGCDGASLRVMLLLLSWSSCATGASSKASSMWIFRNWSFRRLCFRFDSTVAAFISLTRPGRASTNSQRLDSAVLCSPFNNLFSVIASGSHRSTPDVRR